jgi:OmpA-OmpF porin, OOP family
MRSNALTALVVMLTGIGVAGAQEKDAAGSQDHPLVTRIPGYFIDKYQVKDFDSYESPYAPPGEAKWEGKATRISYLAKAGAKPFSMAQIARNYEGALKKIGAKILLADERITCAKLTRGGTSWVEVEAHNDGNLYTLVVIEAKPMEQEVVADAAALQAGIAAEGKVAVYGIFFDTGKSVVKPESNPTLEQIVKLLGQSPKLSLFVVGHTDLVGNPEANAKLSSERAAAVVKALVAKGVAAARLAPAGVGSYCPVATNRTEAGKAKNRRVELVERL